MSPTKIRPTDIEFLEILHRSGSAMRSDLASVLQAAAARCVKLGLVSKLTEAVETGDKWCGVRYLTVYVEDHEQIALYADKQALADVRAQIPGYGDEPPPPTPKQLSAPRRGHLHIVSKDV